jgi:Sulfotransferase family
MGGERAASAAGEAIVEIQEVAVADFRLQGLLQGGEINLPCAGDASPTWALELRGWAVGAQAVPTAVELVHEGAVLHDAPFQVERPKAAARYARTAAGDMIGFHAVVSSLALAPEFELSVVAAFETGEQAEIAIVRGRRAELRTAFVPRLQPLMVTTLGRTGSMMLMRLLEAHPEVLVHRPFRYEQRVASYWIEVLRALAEPASYLRQLAPAGSLEGGRWWLGDDAPTPWGIGDERIQRWMGRDAVVSIAEASQGRVEALYEQIAAGIGGDGARYFAEKYSLESSSLAWELYPGARELFLVRDFRDMVASILAFNRKRGVRGFGEEGTKDELDYVRRLELWAASLVRSWGRRSGRAHLVRYEDLVLEPASTLRGLLGYLDVAEDDATIERMLDTLGEALPELEDHHTAPDPRASIGRWRRDLPDELALACEQSFGPALETFGYERA